MLDDKLHDGTIEDLLLVLATAGASRRARRIARNGISTLNQAIYTPCPVTTPAGCPRKPTWQINAAKVVHDPAEGRLRSRADA